MYTDATVPRCGFNWRGFLRGGRLALPIMLGYGAVSFAFGVLAAKVGMNALEAACMSFFVFAGSGQLIAVDMMSSGMPIASIIFTTFVVNLRHLLMSAVMAPWLAPWSKPAQAAFSWQMTDETFALHMSRFPAAGVDKGEVFGVNVLSHSAWIGGGVLGALWGSVLGDISPMGFDYALAGMFIALLLPHCRIPRRLLAAIIAGAAGTLLTLNGMADWSVIIATSIGATAALACAMAGGNKDKSHA